ncbi:MAG: hypothetical protein QM724_02275 [Flavobacteriales bacterium]
MRPQPNPLFRALLIALACLAVLVAAAQVVNEDELRAIPLEGNTGQIIDIAALPDGHTLLASCAKGAPLLLIDTAGWRIVRSFAVNGFVDGARLSLSGDGRHALLQEDPRFDNDSNRDQETRVAVLDLASGALVLDLPKAHDACFVPDDAAIAVLSAGTVTVHGLNGAVLRTLPIPNAANALAISPDGRTLVVGHRPTVGDLAQVPSIRNDKKALKPALKYRQLISFFDARTGQRQRMVPAIYDVVQALRFIDGGSRLLVYSIPDTRFLANAGGGLIRTGLVEQVDATSGEPLRASCMTRMNAPVLAVSPDAATLALSSSQGMNKRKLTLYDLATGDTKLMIDLAQRRRYDKAEDEAHDGRLGYGWLSDGRLVVAQGTHLGCYRP